MDSNTKKYLRDIKLNLGKNSDIKRAFMSEFSNEVKNYSLERSDITYEKLVEEFGSPSSIAMQFETEKDRDDLRKIAKKYKIIKLVSAFLIITLIIIVIALIDNLRSRNGHITLTNSFENEIAETTENN